MLINASPGAGSGSSIKGAARKFTIDYHALRRHWTNHVSAEARASYVTGAGASKDQLEEIVADEFSRADRSLPDCPRCALQRVYLGGRAGGRQLRACDG